MLRASIDHTGGPVLAVEALAAGAGDSGVEHGAALMAFVDSVALQDLSEFPLARAELEIVAGQAAADRAAMVIGNFSMMNRALDAIGAPVGKGFDGLATEMGLTVPEHLRHD